MSENKNIKLELDSETIKNIATFCELSGLEIPEVITSEFIERSSGRVKEVLIKLKEQIGKLKEQADDSEKKIEELKTQKADLKHKLQDSKTTGTSEDSKEDTKEEKKKERPTKNSEEDDEKNSKPREVKGNINSILIIANIGLIMHQLKILFQKFGCQVTSVKSYSEAIAELKEKEYDCILFDMQSVAEHDLMLVEALRKATEICHTDTVIVILILPIKDKKSLKKIKTRGADIIIQKHESWHMNILKELKIAE